MFTCDCLRRIRGQNNKSRGRLGRPRSGRSTEVVAHELPCSFRGFGEGSRLFGMICPAGRSELWTMTAAPIRNQKESHIILQRSFSGLAITVLGVGLSVTMVLLPVGIPVGLAGLGLLIWGLTPGWRK